MGKIIAVVNQKGGVGKTTTAVNLTAALKDLGKKVLLCDFDPQANATSGLGIDKRKIQKSVYDVVVNEIPAAEAVVQTPFGDVLPATADLAGAGVEMISMPEPNYRLKNALKELRDQYDAVFHLVTAAKGAEEFYTTANNGARIETVEQAVELDDKIIAAWTGHPHFRVIDNETDFEDKMKRLMKEISSFLGGPEPVEIERKFLIEYPDIEWLENLPNCSKIDILQTYLTAKDGEERRIRQRGCNGHYLYFKTTKRGSGLKRVEVEKRLTKDEYLIAMMDADVSRRQIRKTRYCLTWGIQYFEIDVYPFWRDKAIVEIELSDENEPIEFPPQLHVICEVTDDPAYKNARLAEI